jgi:hypothetical protein
VRRLLRAGLPSDPVPGGLRYDKVTGPTAGNSLPPNTGVWYPNPTPPGPGLSAGGTIGGNDGFMGADPRYPKRQPDPSSARVGAWGEGDSSDRGRPTSGIHASFRRFGIQGFNDQLMVRDRHAYWDAGHQRTGIESLPYSVPNTYSHPAEVPPTPELRVVNRSVSPQIGSSNSAAQDDLTRNYTRNAQGMFVGEQGSGWSPVYGGVPGLYQPYGTRGGVPYPIVSPVGEGEPGDGPRLVFAGPPHGLHSPTIPDYAQTRARYGATPQMRPVRADRPSNSPQAGQSYSQTVLAQGAQKAQAQAQARAGYPGGGGGTGFGTGRGWAGVAK